jgi:hypothetical protein
VKRVLCLAILSTSALWADEAADRTAVEATISALNSSPSRPELFTADFPNAAELQRFQQPVLLRIPAEGTAIRTQAGTLVISREPMGEATWYPGLATSLAAIAIAPRFVTRSVTFVSPDTAIVVATYAQESVLFVVKNESANWRIASFRVFPEARVLPEALTKPVL